MSQAYSTNVVFQEDFGQKIGYDKKTNTYGLITDIIGTENPGFFGISQMKIKKIIEISKISKAEQLPVPGTNYNLIITLLDNGLLLFSKMFYLIDASGKSRGIEAPDHFDGVPCFSYKVKDIWLVDIFVYIDITSHIMITLPEWAETPTLKLLLAIDNRRNQIKEVRKDDRSLNSHCIIIMNNENNEEIQRTISSDVIRKIY